MIGATVGNYTITSELGRGGMGVVYLATHNVIQQPAAVKVLLPEYCKDAMIMQRFVNEARAAAAIQHPGIVKVYDFGHFDDGSTYLVMEYLRGESLKEHLKAVGRLSVEQVLGLTRQIIDILIATHDQGIVHRDLKPPNIMLVPEPALEGGVRVRLMDFGIAKLTSDHGNRLTRTGIILGSPAYMAPEQCAGAKNIDFRADLYSLGCVMFCLLCGRPPFLGADITVIASHIFDPAPRPTVFAPFLPAEIEGMILRLLEKKPEDRFADARALLAALDSCSRRMACLQANQGLPPSAAADAATLLAQNSGPEHTAATEPDVMPMMLEHGHSLAAAATTPQIYDTRAVGVSRGRRSLLYAAGVFTVIAVIGIAALVKSGGKGSTASALESDQRNAVPMDHSAPAEKAPSEQAPGKEGPPGVADQEKEIAITITSNPAGAAVYREVGDVRLGYTPYRHPMQPVAGELILVLRHQGYESKTIAVPADKDGSVMVELMPSQREARARRGKSTSPDRATSKKSPATSKKSAGDSEDDVNTLNPFQK